MITGILLGSFEAAFHVANDADRSIASTDYKLSRWKKGKTGDALTESFLLRTDYLERIGGHVDDKDVTSCRTTVEVLIIR